MTKHNWHVKRLSTALGAEITGVRLSDVSAEEAGDVRDLLHEHKVIFFPDQHMSPDDHVAFGRHFGELEGHPNLTDRNADELSLIHI